MPNLPSSTLSEETIQRAADEFGFRLESNQLVCIQRYIRILLQWNEKINLTAIRDPLEILYRHFCESMFGARFLPSTECRLADVGSGGGFPGLPLKIVRPDLTVFLVESNVKKATFLAEVARELGLSEVRVLVSRYEELSEEITPLDVACSRALGEYSKFLEWAKSPVIDCRKVLFWLGGQDLDEVRKDDSWKWEAVLVPHSIRRFVLTGNRAS